MNDKERIEELLHYFRMNGKNFAQKCGFEPDVLANIKREQHGISKKVSEKILAAFPEVNKGWLATGEGEMLNHDLSITKLDKYAGKRHLIPFYDDVCSIGGRQDRVANMASSQPVEYIDTGDWFLNATAAMRHYGDSMTEYQSGCILALKEVQERQLIIWGRDYVIETSEFRITKRIQRGMDKDHIKACSTNEETYIDGSPMHEPIDIHWKDINKISLVLGYVVKKGEGTMVYVDNNNK